MMRYGYGYGGGHWDMWVLMAVAMVVFFCALAWIIVTLLRQRDAQARSGQPIPPSPSPDARRILDERLARGEITEDEYKRLRDLIQAPE